MVKTNTPISIEEQLKEIVDRYVEWLISDKGLEHMGIKSQVKVRLPIKLVDELSTLIKKEREEAVRGFAYWLFPNPHDKDEVEKDISSYLSQTKGVEK
jgi:hypothetical protein